MKHFAVMILSFFITLIAGLFLCFDAAADENICTLKTNADKVHVKEWDEDSDQDRQGKIFKGWLKSGKKKRSKVPPALLFSAIKEAEDDRPYGDNHKTCKGAIPFACLSIL